MWRRGRHKGRAVGVLLLVACLWACGARRDPAAVLPPAGKSRAAAPAPAATEAPAPARIAPALPPRAPGAPLRVGTSGDYPPFSIAAADGALGGLDVEVARAYARDRGVEIEIVRFRWPDLEASLARGDFDVAIGGVTVRGDRLAVAPMTAAVARARAVLVTPPGSQGIDLGRGGEGLTVAVNRGGHLESVARRTLPRATLQTVDDNLSLPDLLRSGAVDGIVTDTAERRSFGLEPSRIAAVLARDRKAYWVRPGDPQLAADLDAWLAQREADGTLASLRATHGVESPGSTAGNAATSTPAARAADLAGRRLLLMPLVAEAKRAGGAPVEDLEREAAVIRAARATACAEGLDPATYAALARAQIEAAKAVQRAVLAAPPGAAAADVDRRAPAPDLQTELRPAIDRIDEALRAELARSAPLGTRPDAIAAALRVDADVPGFDAGYAAAIAHALASVRRAAPGVCPEAAAP